MLTKRIIPCLDIKEGRVMKGVKFKNLEDAGDPIELAIKYAADGADELVFLDISATHEKRKTWTELVKQIAKNIAVPFTVGGGISCAEDVACLLQAGADKVSLNSAVLSNPALINLLARQFGSQCIVVALDVFFEKEEWYVYSHGGRSATGKRALDWAKEAAFRGAGEILLTSMTNDGVKNGFALEITRQISEGVSIPVIASGGAGNKTHFLEALTLGKADAVLAASVFHYHEIKIPELKVFLKQNNIEVRL